MNPDVTQILNQLGEGDSASEKIFPVIYDERRQMAAGKMAKERAGHTLQATDLVNEACIRLPGNDLPWSSRQHFYGAAAEAMRRIPIESARRKLAEKRGLGVADTEFHDSIHGLPESDDRPIQIHEVLDEF